MSHFMMNGDKILHRNMSTHFNSEKKKKNNDRLQKTI